jgi:hypothetical protein
MKYLRSLPPTAAIAVLLVTSAARADESPQLFPTRDVDITYDVRRPQQPKIRERVRWFAAERLERIDGPDKSTTIYDRSAHTVTLLSPKNRTYRHLEGAPRGPMEPEPGAKITRGGDAVVAGQSCVDWSWTEDVETRTACITPDGVVLRVVVDGATVMQARSVSYGPQNLKLFQVPANYAPALAPEGNVGE